MVQGARSSRLLAAAAVLAVVFIAACSSDKSTNPPSGGGVAKELNSPNMGNGAVYRDTFPMTAGVFPYHCKFHAVMTATITVNAGSATTNAAVTINDNSFAPTSVTVGPGAVVTWTNNGVNTHSVTSD